MAGADSSEQPGSNEDRAREGPTDLKREAWGGALKRTVAEFREDNLTVWAAALTYYGVLSIFPALLALISLLGLIGKSATQPLINNLSSVASGPAKQIITSAIQNLQSGRGGAGALFIVSLAAALWAASGYVAAFMQGSNVIYDVGEGRPIWKTLPTRLLTTLVLLLLLAVAAVGVTFTGGLATQAGKLLGVGSSAVTIWDIAKWPVILAIVLRCSRSSTGPLPTSSTPASAGSRPVESSASSSGSSPRRPSRSTSPTSPPTTRPTAPSAE